MVSNGDYGSLSTSGDYASWNRRMCYSGKKENTRHPHNRPDSQLVCSFKSQIHTDTRPTCMILVQLRRTCGIGSCAFPVMMVLTERSLTMYLKLFREAGVPAINTVPAPRVP